MDWFQIWSRYWSGCMRRQSAMAEHHMTSVWLNAWLNRPVTMAVDLSGRRHG